MICFSKIDKPTKPFRWDGSRGSILIVVLLIVSLLTIMVVAFNSLALKDLSATKSYGQSLRAQELARSGLDKIVSQIQAEITDPNNNSSINGSTEPIYIPNNTSAVPQRMVGNALYPIVTASGSNMYSNADGVVSDLASSGNPTTNVSLNNRSISISRWCKPQFLLPAATSSFVPPNWVVVTRDGPQAFPAHTMPSSAGLTVSGLSNMNEAVGRYAYVVYDTSGLLDVNVAGYPSSAASAAGTKGGLPWADLTQLSTSFTQADIDSMVNWRNACNASSYSTYVSNTWATNGFMMVAPGDTRFFSRQDLIDYAQTQNTDLTGVLPYLTTFSRELNGPTCQPTTPAGSTIKYGAQCLTPGVTNPAIFNPRVQAVFTRNNGTIAVVGEPLVKYRFPLDKLALLEKQGTVGLSTQDVASILKYFGLRLASDSSGLYRHWIYTNPLGTSTTGATTILNLDQVAALNREPDFFEMLQAGILSGSLGKIGRGDNIPAQSFLVDNDSNATYQIIRIGANIIDQADADSYPTTITYNSEDFYGIEDLPYINKIFLKVNGTGANLASAVPGPPYDFFLYFELWNPHQAVGSYSNYPTQFQIAPIANDTFHYGIGTASPSPGYWNWYYNASANGGGWTFPAANPQNQFFKNLTNGGVTPFTASATTASTDYREPSLIPGITSAWNGGPPISVLSLGSVPSFPPDGTFDKTGTGIKWSSAIPPVLTQNCATCGIEAVFQLQYKDASGWHTYGTFIGTTDKIATGYASLINIVPTTPGNSTNTAALAKSDPRTYRFGPGEYAPTLVPGYSNSAGYSLTPNQTTVDCPVYGHVIPFMGLVSQSIVAATNPYRVDMWSVNDSTVTPAGLSYNSTPTSTYYEAGSKAPFYKDNDGVQRVGDTRYAYTAAPSISPFYTGNTQARPVVLNRPFQSVGELGYVFRDMPWKTLDLSSSTSADANLLDLFSISDTPITAGRVNPNTASAPVLAALLSGTTANYSGGSMSLPVNSVGPIATALTNAVSTTPFLNRSALVSSFMTNPVVTGAFPDGVKMEREAAVRALAESANTRTWNFMIDIIAQSGNYPESAANLDNFNVTGERRYWLHVAIDRYTGQVVDKQLEVVNE